jgi:hypothetical protein
MPVAQINYLAVVVAALIPMALGMLWYSPALFANAWMKAVNKRPEEMSGAATGYAVSAVCYLVMSFVLAHFVDYAGATDVVSGAVTGLWLWLGFVATALLVTHIFERRSLRLYGIYAGYQLVALLLMGALLAAWA